MAIRHTPPEFEPFLEAMADSPGEAVNLLVFADWLDEHDRPGLAEAVRVQAPLLRKRYRAAAARHDALLALELELIRPVSMPAPDRGHDRSRRQWCGIVRDALRPFKLTGVSVAAAHGWRGGAEIELRLPSADFAICDGSHDGFVVPWGLTSANLLAVGALAFSELMARLFPDEGPRTVHNDGDSFDVSFWRAAIRSQT